MASESENLAAEHLHRYSPHPALTLLRRPQCESLFPSKYHHLAEETEQGLYTCQDAYEEGTIRRVFTDLVAGCVHLSRVGMVVWPPNDCDIYYYTSEDGTTGFRMYVDNPRLHVASSDCSDLEAYFSQDPSKQGATECRCIHLKCRLVLQSVLDRYSIDMALRDGRCEGWDTDCPCVNTMTGEISNSDSIVDKLSRALFCKKDWLNNICSVLDIDSSYPQEEVSQDDTSDPPLTRAEEVVLDYVQRDET